MAGPLGGGTRLASSPSAEKIYVLSENRLVETPEAARAVTFQGAQTNGAAAGVWCPYGNTTRHAR